MTLPGADEARRQREQLERYLTWVQQEGGHEGPTHLDTFFRPEQQARLNWLKDHCEGSLMEVGCCYGFILAFCGGQIGVDLSPKSIALARILNPRKVFMEGDIRKLPLQDATVDCVLIPDCLEHIPFEDVPQALAEVLRVARKKVLITLPNSEYATRTSAHYKHRWLVSQNRLEALLDVLRVYNVLCERNYYWVLLEVAKTVKETDE